MTNRYSIPTNNPADRTERIYFFYWQDMVDYLRNEMEADGKTYRMNITGWTKSAKGTMATCQLQWVRINEEGFAHVLSRTVRCEDIDLISYVEYHEANEYRKAWKCRVFNEAEW